MLWFGFKPALLDSHPKPLGRFAPTDSGHIDKYPVRADAPITVEHAMPLPWWHWTHDQGNEGACVGHGTAMERAIRERFERRSDLVLPYTVRFDPWWLWDQAKVVDGWPETNPGDDNGTSVRAAYDVVRAKGAVRHIPTATVGSYAGANYTDTLVPNTEWSVATNRWATTIDDIRACIARNQPVTIGVNWYTNFDRPALVGTRDYFIGQGDLGTVRGGHCVCIYGASDRRQAFRVKNSWGRAYPLVWLTYSAMARLLSEDGEATVVTDDDTNR